MEKKEKITAQNTLARDNIILFCLNISCKIEKLDNCN